MACVDSGRGMHIAVDNGWLFEHSWHDEVLYSALSASACNTSCTIGAMTARLLECAKKASYPLRQFNEWPSVLKYEC